MNKYLQPRKYMQFGKRVIAAVLRRTPVIRNHHRLRSRIDCVTAACNLISDNYDEIESYAFNKTIKRRLSWLGINFRQLHTHHTQDLYAVFAEQPLQPDRYDELKQQMLEVPVELLPCRQWLNLHEMCCFRGRYTLAQIFREKARQLAIKPLERKDVKPSISWENTIGAAIEGGECHRSEHLAQLLERAGITGDVASKWQIYLAVLNGQDISREWVKRFDGSDFAEYLDDKSVAIVGPAPTDAFDAEEIDTCDVVVRLNQSYEGKGTDSKHKGQRANVVYFNGGQANCLIKDGLDQIPQQITWACFKENYISAAKSLAPERNIRATPNISRYRYHGSFNMLPLIIFDVLLCKPNSVKVFHMDLMLTVARQKKYYPKSFGFHGKEKEVFLKYSVEHDPIMQYIFLQKSYLLGRITGDDPFADVMNIGLNAYLSELEIAYASASHV